MGAPPHHSCNSVVLFKSTAAPKLTSELPFGGLPPPKLRSKQVKWLHYCRGCHPEDQMHDFAAKVSRPASSRSLAGQLLLTRPGARHKVCCPLTSSSGVCCSNVREISSSVNLLVERVNSSETWREWHMARQSSASWPRY